MHEYIYFLFPEKIGASCAYIRTSFVAKILSQQNAINASAQAMSKQA
ncbi:MAG: hypothetical protein JEY97_13900 [Bacteroidales bacterium]|nr:hypothetical protein [Bacteroidales bacterium]